MDDPIKSRSMGRTNRQPKKNKWKKPPESPRSKKESKPTRLPKTPKKSIRPKTREATKKTEPLAKTPESTFGKLVAEHFRKTDPTLVYSLSTDIFGMSIVKFINSGEIDKLDQYIPDEKQRQIIEEALVIAPVVDVPLDEVGTEDPREADPYEEGQEEQREWKLETSNEDEDPYKEKGKRKDLLRLYFKDIGRISLITDEEVTRLYKMIEKAERKGDRTTVTKAKKKMVEANLRLVVSIAKKFFRCGILPLDLIQAGNIGLMKAVDGFKYELGFKFSTYASKWIYAAITRTISNQVRTVRIPVNVIPALKKVDRSNRKLSRQLGRRPTTGEIADDAGIEPDKIRAMARIPQRPISLDLPIDGNDGDATLGDILADPNADTSDMLVDKHFFSEILESALSKVLDDREITVLKMRYGLLDGVEYTQSEIAEYLKLSRQRISQIENRALLRLRHASHTGLLEAFLR